MYSSCISAPRVEVSFNDPAMLICESRFMLGDVLFNNMELYPVDYWYQYNVDGFGEAYYNEWDLFWFEETLRGWSVI